MKYDYNKLKSPDCLDVIETHFKTREMNIVGNVIHLGNGVMFLVENGIVQYTGGLNRSTTEEVVRLGRVMEKLQSAVSLYCPVFD